MNIKNRLIAGTTLHLLIVLSLTAYAGSGTATGTTKVVFGQANSKLRDCSGTGICQMGNNIVGGVDASIQYIEVDSATTAVKVILIKFNYADAVKKANFINPMDGDNQGVLYAFQSGNGQPTIINARGSGIPIGTSIPAQFVALFSPADASGMATLVLTLFSNTDGTGD